MKYFKYWIIPAILLVLTVFCCNQFSFFRGMTELAQETEADYAEQVQEAYEDSLYEETTGLLRYDVFKAFENQAIQELEDGQQLVHISVGFGSLDRGLKGINDNYGHINGSHAIMDFAEVLKEVFPEDQFVVCHRGGSSFLVYTVGEYTTEDILAYYEELKAMWHDTPYQVWDGTNTVEGMALTYLAAFTPDNGMDFDALAETLTYKKDALLNVTNCGYVIMTGADTYVSSVEIDETPFLESAKADKNN